MNTYPNFVAGEPLANQKTFLATTGHFAVAGPPMVDKALEAASDAFATYSQTPLSKRTDFLQNICDQLNEKKEEILSAYVQESKLPQGRAEGEFGRTLFQIQAFIALLERGTFLQASLSGPAEGVDLRKMLQPLGPVAVFGASNFPLAFSTAGGDTLSALTAGCPVVVKAHPYHPLTSFYVAQAIQAAVEKTQLPKGVFSHLQSDTHELGQVLVSHPLLAAVGFTGSFAGGKALYDLAQKRNVPIPVFAEMGSINPMVLFPSVLTASTLVQQLGDSIALGSGQFCTNPGLLIAWGEASELDRLEIELSNYLTQKEAQPMAHSTILSHFESKIEHLKKEIKTYVGSQAVLGVVETADFLAKPLLHEEVFGPFSLLVRCKSEHEVTQIIQSLGGQLTLSLLGESPDYHAMKRLIPLAQQKAGRILFKGVPTGVAVTQTMTHGGPFPASTDARYTAVGTDAIYRWLRPVSFQDCPNALLPQPLQNENPWKIERIVDGKKMK